MSAVSTFKSMAPAVSLSLLPKMAGSIARVGDDWNAPKDVRRGTVVREAATLAQVATYAAIIERSVKFMKDHARQMVKNGQKNMFTGAMHQLEKSEPLFLAGLAFTSNITAEMISRKVSPRNLWRKVDSKTNAKNADVKNDAKPEPSEPAIQATLVDEAKGKEIPVEIEICVAPSRKSDKESPRFEAAPKTQPLQFTSRPTGPVANPFQLDTTPFRTPSSSVASPAFQV